MGKDFEKEITNIPNVKLTPGKPAACLGNGDTALSAAVTSATTFCFVFPNLIPKTQTKTLLSVTFQRTIPNFNAHG